MQQLDAVGGNLLTSDEYGGCLAPDPPTQTEIDAARNEIDLWLYLTITVLAFHLLGLLLGISTFSSKTVSLVHILLHALGGVRLSLWAIHDQHYKIIWRIFGWH